MIVPDAAHHLKVPVVRRQVYTLYLEQATADHTFIHCDVHGTWTPRTKRDLAADWQTLQALHGGPLYAMHTPGDHKHLKFLSMFGFRRAASFTDTLGRPMEIHHT